MPASLTRAFRFAFISTMNGVPWGGSEELWGRAALRLRELGHFVSVSVIRWPTRPKAVDQMVSAGIQVQFRPKDRNGVDRRLSRWLRPWFPGELDFREVRWLRRAAPELVVVSQGGPWDGVPWMFTCLGLKLPYCGIVQANSEIWWPTDAELQQIRPTFRSARRLFFVSQANRELAERQSGLHLDNAEVVANPVNIASRQEVDWPGDTGETRLACVARLDPRAKGQDVLFQVLAQPKWRERPLSLHLYGTGPGEDSLRALVSLLRLEKVHFHGHVSDVAKIWAENHALILPSRFEGLPLAIIEAMLCGRPVIATDVAGNAEPVRDGREGFIAAAPTVALLDEAMERAWLARNRWAELGRNAWARALEVTPENPVEEFAERLLHLVSAVPIPSTPKTAARAELAGSR